MISESFLASMISSLLFRYVQLYNVDCFPAISYLKLTTIDLHFYLKPQVQAAPTPNLTPRSEVAAEPQDYVPFTITKQLLLIYGATSNTGKWMVRQALASGLFKVLLLTTTLLR